MEVQGSFLWGGASWKSKSELVGVGVLLHIAACFLGQEETLKDEVGLRQPTLGLGTPTKHEETIATRRVAFGKTMDRCHLHRPVPSAVQTNGVRDRVPRYTVNSMTCIGMKPATLYLIRGPEHVTF